MKISKDLKNITTTQKEMAKVLGISQQRISQLVKGNVMVRDETGAIIVIESFKNYYKCQEKDKDGKEISLDHEKAVHERVKRELSEIKLEETKNNLHSTDDIMLIVGGLVANFRRKLLGLPNKMANRIEGKSADDINELLTKEIHDSLIELSELDPSKLVNDKNNTE